MPHVAQGTELPTLGEYKPIPMAAVTAFLLRRGFKMGPF